MGADVCVTVTDGVLGGAVVDVVVLVVVGGAVVDVEWWCWSWWAVRSSWSWWAARWSTWSCWWCSSWWAARWSTWSTWWCSSWWAARWSTVDVVVLVVVGGAVVDVVVVLVVVGGTVVDVVVVRGRGGWHGRGGGARGGWHGRGGGARGGWHRRRRGRRGRRGQVRVHDRPGGADDLDVRGVVVGARPLPRSRRLDPDLVQALVRVARRSGVGEVRLKLCQRPVAGDEADEGERRGVEGSRRAAVRVGGGGRQGLARPPRGIDAGLRQVAMQRCLGVARATGTAGLDVGGERRVGDVAGRDLGSCCVEEAEPTEAVRIRLERRSGSCEGGVSDHQADRHCQHDSERQEVLRPGRRNVSLSCRHRRPPSSYECEDRTTTTGRSVN